MVETSKNERMCFSKKRYSTEAYANRVAREAKAVRGVDLRVYKCPHCLWWHLTKKPLACSR